LRPPSFLAYGQAYPQELQFFVAQLAQELDDFDCVEVFPLPESTANPEKSLLTRKDEQRGHFRRLD